MTSSGPGVRINRYLALCGLGARREAEELVRAGRVAVNGSPLADLAYRVREGDRVQVDGKAVKPRKQFRYILYYKQPGVLTTTRDPHQRRILINELPKQLRDLKPVGRLDADTEGLIILTDDGGFAQRVAHPSYNIPKRYYVEVAGRVTRGDAKELERGVSLLDGHIGRCHVNAVDTGLGESRVILTVSYGRKRMIRQMFASLGYKVKLLRRVAIGSVELGTLAPGEWRELTAEEVAALAGGDR